MTQPRRGRTPAVAGEPLPGYDALSARDVVSRLGTLAPDARTAVAAYERANRGRRTILDRVSALGSRPSRRPLASGELRAALKDADPPPE